MIEGIDATGFTVVPLGATVMSCSKMTWQEKIFFARFANFSECLVDLDRFAYDFGISVDETAKVMRDMVNKGALFYYHKDGMNYVKPNYKFLREEDQNGQ